MATRFQRLPTHFRPRPTYIWHCRHGPRSTDIRNLKCGQKPELILTSGYPPVSSRIGRCRHCVKLVGLSRKCWVCAEILRISHSIPQILMRTSGLLSAMLNCGCSWRRTMWAMAQVSRAWSNTVVAACILFLYGFELDTWVWFTSFSIHRCKITL